MEYHLPFPFRGLSDNNAVGGQPDGTTGDALNVRGVDSVTGRTRGGQRAGLSGYSQGALGDADQPVQELAQTMKPVDHLLFTELSSTTPGGVNAAATGSIQMTATTAVLFVSAISATGDTVTISDGSRSDTFEFVGVTYSPSDISFIPVEGTFFDSPADLLEKLGLAIDGSRLQMGWTVEQGAATLLRLTNGDARAGESGNVLLTGSFLNPGNYALLGMEGGSLIVANTLLTDWERQPAAATRTVALAKDAFDNLWTLSSNHVAVRYNSGGAVLATVNVPTDAGFTLVESMAEDSFGAIYFATTASDDVRGDDIRSKLFRFAARAGEEVGDLPTFELSWEHDITEGRVLALEESAGILYATFASRFTLPADLFDTDSEDTGRISGYAPLTGTAPLRVFTKGLPFWPYALGVMSDGNVAVCYPEHRFQGEWNGSNSLMKAIPEPNLWTPWELDAAEERLHFWVRAEDAEKAGSVLAEDGEEVVLWPDHRLVTPAGSTAVHDTTVRDLAKGQRNGPRVDANGFGGRPSLRFNDLYSGGGITGECLVTPINGGATPKATTSDALGSDFSPIPSFTDSLYACFFIIRLDPADAVVGGVGRLLFSQHSNGSVIASPTDTSHAFHTNVKGGDWTIGGFTPPDGGEVWYNPGPFYALAGTHVPGSVTGGDLLAGAALTPTPTSPNNDGQAGIVGNDRIAIVSIVKGQSAGAGGNVSTVRVNGRQVDCYEHQQDLCRAARFVLGCRRHQDAEDTGGSGDLFQSVRSPTFGAVPSFRGHIGEIVTILGASSAANSPHDIPVTCPVSDGGTGGSIAAGYEQSGSAPQSATLDRPELATEVELMEGYLAHKYGCGHLLESRITTGDETSNSTCFYQRHPFGGVGWYPKGTDRVDDDLHHLHNYQQKVLLFSPGLNLLDSFWGAGVGRTLGADTDRRLVSSGLNDQAGHDSARDTTLTGRWRRLSSSGGKFSGAKRAEAWINLTSVPADGTTITISDGVTSEVFEFNSGPATIGILIDTTGGGNEFTSNLRQTVTNLRVAIAASALNTLPYSIGSGISLDQGLYLTQLFPGFAGNTTIGTTTATGVIEITSFTGGSEQGENWSIGGVKITGEYDGRNVPIHFDQGGNFYYGLRASGVTTDAVGRLGSDGSEFLIHAFDATESPRAVVPLNDPPDYDEEALPSAESLYVITERGAV